MSSPFNNQDCISSFCLSLFFLTKKGTKKVKKKNMLDRIFFGPPAFNANALIGRLMRTSYVYDINLICRLLRFPKHIAYAKLTYGLGEA